MEHCKSCFYYKELGRCCRVFGDIKVDPDDVCLIYTKECKEDRFEPEWFRQQYQALIGARKYMSEEENRMDGIRFKINKEQKRIYEMFKPCFDEAGVDFFQIVPVQCLHATRYPINCSVALKLVLDTEKVKWHFSEHELRNRDLIDAGYEIITIPDVALRSSSEEAKQKERISNIIKRLTVEEAHRGECRSCLLSEYGKCGFDSREHKKGGYCRGFCHAERVVNVKRKAIPLDQFSELTKTSEWTYLGSDWGMWDKAPICVTCEHFNVRHCMCSNKNGSKAKEGKDNWKQPACTLYCYKKRYVGKILESYGYKK